MEPCPSNDQLRLFLTDETFNPEAAAIEAHAATCMCCQQVLARLAEEDGSFLRGLAASPPQWYQPTVPPEPGQRVRSIIGPRVPGYELLDLLGQGGMGVVYKARHLQLNRLVALKMVSAGSHARPMELARFRIEAEAVAMLSHPNIVQLFEVGETEGCPFLVMELVNGGNLAQRLRQTPFAPRAAAELMRVLANAIQHAHRSGVIHRDLKPQNVLLTADGQPKVADFGLAKRLSATDGQTRTGQVFGTPEYMAPEQATGKPGAISQATDVYSLGAILYEVLTGRPPFHAETPLATLLLVQNQEPTPPSQLRPGLPRDLETICLKCLQKEPARRYSDCTALADDLGRFVEGKPVSVRPPGPGELLLMWANRNPTIASLLAVIGFVLIVASFLMLWQWHKAETNLAEAIKERNQRTQAQISALQTAAPEAVPAILDDLATRPEVSAELRRLYAQETDRHRKQRLALSLPGVGHEELMTGMLEADLAEALMVRDRLKESGLELAPDLWAKAEDESRKSEERLRALAALAVFDKDNPKWQAWADLAMSELLKQNALHLRTWVTAFQPVRAMLLSPLMEVFSGRHALSEKHRETAALVLADYADDRPDVIAELLLEADPRQFRLLQTAMMRHREVVVAHITAELARPPDSRWKDAPLEAKWQHVQTRIKEEIEKAGGMFEERFALCQSLPLYHLEVMTEALRPSGYRPIRVRPWAGGAAVIWTRDGRNWKLNTGLTATEVAKAREAGMLPADVAGYATKDGDRYTLLWASAEKGEEALAYAGVEAIRHDKHIAALKNAGLVAATVHGFTREGTTRYSGVWRKGPGAPKTWTITSGFWQSTFEENLDSLPLVDVSVTALQWPTFAQHWSDRLAQTKKGEIDRGMALFYQGKNKEAIEAFDAMATKDAATYLSRAMSLARAGRLADAMADAQRCATLDGERLGLLAKARVAGYGDDQSKALAALEKAIDATPQDPTWRLSVARTYGMAAEANRVRLAREALELVGRAVPIPWVSLEDWAQKYEKRAEELVLDLIDKGHRNFLTIEMDSLLEAVWQKPAYRQHMVRAGGLRGYSFLLHEEPWREVAVLHGLLPDAHLARCRELASSGYRPNAISVVDINGEARPVSASVWHRPTGEAAGAPRARRAANAAATLLILNPTEVAWNVFKHKSDPTARSYLVARTAPMGVEAQTLVKRLDEEKDVSARRALILGLGEYTNKEFPTAIRTPLTAKLLDWYRNDPDAGIHGAIDWLLRQSTEGENNRALDWSARTNLERIDRDLAGKNAQKQDWYVNGQGQTFTIVRGPVESRLGSPTWEPDRTPRTEELHTETIPRTYAIATKAVTVQEWVAFRKENPHIDHLHTSRQAPQPDSAIASVTFYEALAYCNWLSKKEGIDPKEWCYPEDIKRGMSLLPGMLKRKGYRLPTEAEWEHACRAGSVTSRYYGSAVELLERYAWYAGNAKERLWPVGQKRPNDLGLFDMHGNVWCWCVDEGIHFRLSQTREYLHTTSMVDERRTRSLRGTAFASLAPSMRSAFRGFALPSYRDGSIGLRVCRTYDP